MAADKPGPVKSGLVLYLLLSCLVLYSDQARAENLQFSIRCTYTARWVSNDSRVSTGDMPRGELQFSFDLDKSRYGFWGVNIAEGRGGAQSSRSDGVYAIVSANDIEIVTIEGQIRQSSILSEEEKINRITGKYSFVGRLVGSVSNSALIREGTCDEIPFVPLPNRRF